MALLESLGIRSAGAAASVTLHEYVSDRSVALLLRPSSTALNVGSGTCVRIRDTFILVTAGRYNVEGVALDQIEGAASGK